MATIRFVSFADLKAFAQSLHARHSSSDFYGTCSTAAATQAKTVSMSGVSALENGTTIRVRMANGNTHASPTLSVNSLTAKPILAPGGITPSYVMAGSILPLVYDSTVDAWLIVDAQYMSSTTTWDQAFGASAPAQA